MARLCKLQKGCFRLPAANDKVYQLLTHGRWFSPRVFRLLPPLKLVATILLKVALKHQNSIYQSINYMCIHNLSWKVLKCVGARIAQWVRSLDLTVHTSLPLIWLGFAPSFVNYKKGCTRLAAASDKVYQLLAQGRWFSPGTSASSTTKTGRHDIAEILLNVALNTQKKSPKIILKCVIYYQLNHNKILISGPFLSHYRI